MNLEDKQTFVLEEITSWRMQQVNSLLIADAAAGLTADNRGSLRDFRCPSCNKTTVTVDEHIGETQAVIDCAFCEGEATQSWHVRTPVRGNETIVQGKFFRPMSEAEVDAYVEDVTRSAAKASIPFGGDPNSEDHPLRFALTTGSATRLINGQLEYMPLLDASLMYG